jgi:chromosome segregation ATPase
MKSVLTSVLLVLLLAAASASLIPSAEARVTPPAETRSRFAALDEVRLLANGLLQLGQSLREFVHKTRGQMNDIFQKINIFDRSFYQLSVLASEIRDEEEELKKTTLILQANNEEVKSLSREINSKVEGILEERSRLQSKVGGLEEQLSSLSPDLERLNELAYRLPLSDRDMKRLQGLNRTWASHSAHLTERFRYGMARTGHLSVALHVNVRRAP